jgi:hypothetical protein
MGYRGPGSGKGKREEISLEATVMITPDLSVCTTGCLVDIATNMTCNT